jgi:pyruvate,water dikinase
VRSSAANEDTAQASAAGQHESFLAVHGLSAVADAVRACWASLYSRRAVDYRGATDQGQPLMAVLVQRQVDAEVSGVMFTPTDPDGGTEIEASWGLGVSVVGGTVTPDAFRIAEDGSVTRSIADKRVRLDRHGPRLVTHDVPSQARSQPSIDDETAARLARLGQRVAAVLGGAQDIEWAIADRGIWLLQARPVTVAPPAPSPSSDSPASLATLVGTAGSHGTATGTARIVRGPSDFARVRPGDILVCPYTDPAWTPLLRVAAGVVTETGGVLSHAAIVARERHIPAVLGISNATTRLQDGSTITVNGSAGIVTPTPA